MDEEHEHERYRDGTMTKRKSTTGARAVPGTRSSRGVATMDNGRGRFMPFRLHVQDSMIVCYVYVVCFLTLTRSQAARASASASASLRYFRACTRVTLQDLFAPRLARPSLPPHCGGGRLTPDDHAFMPFSRVRLSSAM